MGPSPEGRGLGLNGAFRVSVIDVAAHSSSVHSYGDRQLEWPTRDKMGPGQEEGVPTPHTPGHTHPWVQRGFHNRACGSRAGHHAVGRTGTVLGIDPSPRCPEMAMAMTCGFLQGLPRALQLQGHAQDHLPWESPGPQTSWGFNPCSPLHGPLVSESWHNAHSAGRAGASPCPGMSPFQLQEKGR